MTDSADARNEQHAGRETPGENLSIMAGTAGHTDPIVGCVNLGCRSQSLLDGLVHGGGFNPGEYGFQADLHRSLLMGFLYDHKHQIKSSINVYLFLIVH